MRVLFVWLNHDSPVGFSNGIAVLSAELKTAGHQVALLHVNEDLGYPYDLDRIGVDVANHTPDVVALSFGTNHTSAAAEIVQKVRRVVPDIWMVVGGIHATLATEQVVSWPGVDIVAIGEADDNRFVRLVNRLATGQIPQGFAGFWFCRNGVVERNPLPPLVDLSAHPQPMDLELFDHPKILELKQGWADVHTSRGCAYRCSYCCNESLREKYREEFGDQVKGRAYLRRRPVAAVLEELRQYQTRYGDLVRLFSFTDDDFLCHQRWCREFFDAYVAEFDLPLVFMATADAINSDIANRSAAAGTYMVRMGVESGSNRLRERVLNRRTPSHRIHQAVTALRNAGIRVWAYNMLGIPSETMADAWSTFQFAVDLRCDVVRFSIYWPYPGTRLNQVCVRDGLVRDELGFVGNNLTDTPLRWPHRQQRFYCRISQFFDVPLNYFLCQSKNHDFAELLRRIETTPDSVWANSGADEVRMQADSLVRELLDQGEKAYTAPAPGRCDILVLNGS